MKVMLFFSSVFLFVLFSCLSTSSVIAEYDESIPLEKTARLCTTRQGVIVGYNGIGVNWETKGNEMIQIPAGDTLLEWNLNAHSSGYYFQGDGILFRYNFQPQKQYLFLVAQKEKVWGFNIWSYDFNEKTPSRITTSAIDHLIDFAPFLNVSSKTILK